MWCVCVYVCGVCVCVSRSVLSVLMYILNFLNTHTHTYIYIYVCVCVFVCNYINYRMHGATI